MLVVDNPDYVIPAQLRRQWLQAEHPGARVHIIPDIGKDDDSVAWAAHAMQFLGYAPDVVYSSEEYGPNWVHYMGAQHVMVDRAPPGGAHVRHYRAPGHPCSLGLP